MIEEIAYSPERKSRGRLTTRYGGKGKGILLLGDFGGGPPRPVKGGWSGVYRPAVKRKNCSDFGKN